MTTKWWWTRGGVAVIGIGFLVLYSAAESCRVDYSKRVLASARAVATQPSTQIPAAMTVEAIALPETENVSVSAASFVGGELYACSDISMSMPSAMMARAKASDAGLQSAMGASILSWLAGKTNDIPPPNGTPQLLTKSCEEQFSRPVLATCAKRALEKMKDGGPSLGSSIHVAYLQIPPDAAAAACLAGKGDWTEVARDSREYLYEKLQESNRRFVKAVGE